MPWPRPGEHPSGRHSPRLVDIAFVGGEPAPGRHHLVGGAQHPAVPDAT